MWGTRGDLLADLGRHEEALASYNRAVEIAPSSRRAWMDKAKGLSELHRFEDANAAYERAAELSGPDPMPTTEANLFNSWGVSLRLQGRLAEALERTDRALEISPDDALAWANRARVLIELGQYDDAVASCDRALSLAPGDPYVLEIRAALTPPND